MKSLLNKLRARLGDLWWYSQMIFVACRSGDVIQAVIGQARTHVREHLHLRHPRRLRQDQVLRFPQI